MRSPVLRSLLFVALCSTAASTVAQQPYRVLDKWKIGGTGGWDYLLVDSDAHLLYLTHTDRVDVVDTKTGKIAGAITGLKGTHGIALDPDGKTGYISDGRANAVVVFDRASFKTLATIPVGKNPDGLLYEPSTKTVWAFNGGSKDATVVDTSSRSVVGTVALPGRPEFPQADGKGNVFVNMEDRNSLVKIDAKSKQVTATWPMQGCESPSGLAIDTAQSRLFAVCDGSKMAVVDAKSGKVLALPAIGDGPDAAGYDAKRELAFSSNGGDGTLSVIDAKNGYKAIETLPTQKGARTMSYDAKTDRIYLASAEFGPKPAASAANAHVRPPILPDTFTVLVVGR